MRTDKQVLRIFAAVPEWLFELTGLESPGPCELKSFIVKELERRADGLIVPFDPSRPLVVVEFQFQFEEAIYTRVVEEMTAAQRKHGMRAVEGLIVLIPWIPKRSRGRASSAHIPLTRYWLDWNPASRIIRSWRFLSPCSKRTRRFCPSRRSGIICKLS